MSTQTFEGKTVEEALAAATASLGVEAGELDYEVEEKAADFWGLGDTTFVVTVRIAASGSEAPAEEEVEDQPETVAPAAEAPEAAAPAQDAEEAVAEPPATDEPAEPEFASGTLADENAETLPPFFDGFGSDEDTASDDEAQEPVPATSEPTTASTPEPAATAVDTDETAPDSTDGPETTSSGSDDEPTVDGVGVSEHAQKILVGIFGAMGFECEAEAKVDGDTMHVAITGGDVQYLLEGRGRGLAALELILNHSFRAYPERAHKRVRVDAGDFRSQRDDELRDMAYQVAHRAKETGEPQQTAELNPYERRIIHLTLSEDDRVTTRSLGNGFLKAVNVIPTSRPSRRRR
jgi:spoIIIJ-associated protein